MCVPQFGQHWSKVPFGQGKLQILIERGRVGNDAFGGKSNLVCGLVVLKFTLHEAEGNLSPKDVRSDLLSTLRRQKMF